MTNASTITPQIAPRQRGLAITALVLGIIAILTAAVPVLGALLGIASIIVGAIALKKKQHKGFSLTGLILGTLAAITSVVVTVVLIMMTGNMLAFLDEASIDIDQDPVIGQDQALVGVEETNEGSDVADAPVAFERILWSAFDTADAPLSSQAGTSDDPHPLGSRFAVEDKWEVVVNLVDRDAHEHLLALAPETTPPLDGERYVLVNMTVKSLAAEPTRVDTLSVYYDAPGQLYSASRPGAIAPDPVLFGNDMQITGNYTGYVAYLTTDTDGEFLRFAEWTTTKHIFVSVE